MFETWFRLLLRAFWLFSILTLLVGCTPSPQTVWKFKAEAPIYGAPAICGNKLVVGSSDHYLYALDVKTGDLSWKVDLGDRILMTPHIEGNSIYVGAASGYFYSLNGDNGKIQWRFKSDQILEFDVCADATGLYFGSYNGNFYKLDRTGRLLWSYQTGLHVTSSCVFYKDLVLTSSWDTNFYGFRRDTGEAAWKVSTGLINYSGPVLHNDSVFYATHEDLYHLNAENGEILYRKKTGYVQHLLIHEGFLYGNEAGLTKRTLEGSLVKTMNLKSWPEFRIALINNVIVTADTLKTLYGISTNLEILWKFKAKSQFWTPGVFHDGIYYIANPDSYVYALRLPN